MSAGQSLQASRPATSYQTARQKVYVVLFQSLRQPGDPAQQILFSYEGAFLEHYQAVQYAKEIIKERHDAEIHTNEHYGLPWSDNRTELQVFAVDGAWRSVFVVEAFVRQSPAEIGLLVPGQRIWVVVDQVKPAKIHRWVYGAWVPGVFVDIDPAHEEHQQQCTAPLAERRDRGRTVVVQFRSLLLPMVLR